MQARAEADRALARDMRKAAFFARGNSKALAANFVHKKKEADNKRARANVPSLLASLVSLFSVPLLCLVFCASFVPFFVSLC